MRTIACSLIVVFSMGALIGRGSAAAQAPAQEQSVLAALLSEVRGLRAAMEQMASAGPRVQLALGRLQLQEQRVNTLLRRLETTREGLAAAQRQLAELQDQMSQVEEAIRSGTAHDRAAAADMSVSLKRELTSKSAEVQRLTAEEASLASDIASEQGRWSEINQRLEALERTLAR